MYVCYVPKPNRSTDNTANARVAALTLTQWPQFTIGVVGEQLILAHSYYTITGFAMFVCAIFGGGTHKHENVMFRWHVPMCNNCHVFYSVLPNDEDSMARHGYVCSFAYKFSHMCVHSHQSRNARQVCVRRPLFTEILEA